jgi:nicotinamide-nucleotide amidase
MRAAILSIGTELLRGDIVDTNAAYLARQLTQLGFDVRQVQQVGDELDVLIGAFSSALGAAEVVLATGGLGPTQDDLTRQAIAACLEEQLTEDERLAGEIAARFGAMGRRMPACNRRQATLIPSARPIHNDHGTAPGWFVENDGRIIVAMPGPPGEMEPMWRDCVLPEVEKLLSRSTAMRSLMTFGLGESAVEERISDLIGADPRLIIATYAKENGVQVHITARADTLEEAGELADDSERAVRERLAEAVFGTGDDTLSTVVGRLLRERGWKLASIESCTGGELANAITDTAGSSDYYVGGIVAYTLEAKAAHGVDREVMRAHGLISAETAMAMAGAARDHFGSDSGIGVTGVAGDEPVEGHPAGTAFIAVSFGQQRAAREIHRPARRSVVKHFVALCALDLLRRELLRQVETPV